MSRPASCRLPAAASAVSVAISNNVGNPGDADPWSRGGKEFDVAEAETLGFSQDEI